MKYEIKVPAVGESITEATIGNWVKKNGEAIKKNDVLLLLETDKASVEVVSEYDGVLFTQAEAGQVVKIGATIGYIDSETKATASSATITPPPPPTTQTAPITPAVSSGGKTHPELQAHLSPAVQKIVTEKNMDTSGLTGTGKDGRLTKADVMNAPSTTSQSKPAPISAPAAANKFQPGQSRRVPMTHIRKRIAERLVEAQHNAAILTTFNEIDMTNIMELRTKYKDKFKEKYGVNLGMMGIFAKAAVEALKAFPLVNAWIVGNEIEYHDYFNLGVAVSTDKGLMVPVIRNVDQMSVAQIELAIRDYAAKARDGKISVDDLNGGTFSITNGGVFGSLLSTPILNAPQSAILGMHKLEDRAVVIDKKIEVRTMMYVALSYDHRIIDGKEAVGFLVKIKEGVENPERLLLEV